MTSINEIATTVADEAVARARPSRAGWKQDVHAAAFAAAFAAGQQWQEAERDQRRREFYAAEHARRVAEKSARNAAGVVRLGHIYGWSYFGSGGAYGRTAAINAVVCEHGDNGFVAGPVAYRVVDRTQVAEVWAAGGDCIGEGREWREAYRWDPTSQAWLEWHPLYAHLLERW
jgi:hypothetical protein